MSVQQALGLHDLALLQDVHAEGSSAGQMIQNAALYVCAGLAKNVLCIFADAMLQEGVRSGDAFAVSVPHGDLRGWEAAHGLFGAVAAYGLVARRHMELYGTTEEHFAAVAIAARSWAAGNPYAVARAPMTLEDHHASPWIAEPFRKLDCAFPVNGAVAVLVSAPGTTDGRRPLVHIAGIGQGHRGNLRESGCDADVSTGARQAAQQALRTSGYSLDDVDVCQLYDCFTYTTIVTLEDFGFCPKGEGGDFVLDGNIGPGGSIPTNTGGGQLSGYYMQGMTPVSEAIIQLRGDGGERQVDGASVALVGCQGGVLDYHACLILTTEDQRAR
jgi:acetyl-CoA acetyltransferase